MGRPSTFSPEIAAQICERLSTGMTLREACRDENFPPEATVRLWALDDVSGFAAQYARAREIGYLCMADECIDIADDSSNDWIERRNEKTGQTEEVFNNDHFQRSRLMLDTRKWLLSKCLPKIYGDKVSLAGHDGGALQVVVQKFTGESE